LDTKITKDTKIAKLADEPAKALPQLEGVEVHEIPKSEAGELEVGKQLRLVEAQDGLDRLYLDNDSVSNDQIEPISRIKSKAFVFDRQTHLPPDTEPSPTQFMGKAVCS
jgi:hypothetical protein